MQRKTFLKTGSAALATMVLNPFDAFPQQDKKPPYSADVVKAFVSAGHNNLAKVKEMLAEFPHLLYASWDLGNGDFEQAIDGAAHVGDREIAEYLISQGARPNIFTMTMLGETELVKAMLSKYPPLLNSLGAHGFTLLHHAKRGGDPAKELFDFFSAKGLKEMQSKLS